jgi:hypothetical protein
VADNTLARQFRAERPNEVWTWDITYIWTAQGWLYPVVLLDLYSRLVVGWAVSEDLSTEFVERLHRSVLQPDEDSFGSRLLRTGGVRGALPRAVERGGVRLKELPYLTVH